MLDAFGERLSPPEGMHRLIADERYGRKNGRGFYLYGDKKKGVDQSVYEVLGVTDYLMCNFQSTPSSASETEKNNVCRAYASSSTATFSTVAERVAALMSHPGLLCWYLFDEPDIFLSRTPQIIDHLWALKRSTRVFGREMGRQAIHIRTFGEDLAVGPQRLEPIS